VGCGIIEGASSCVIRLWGGSCEWGSPKKALTARKDQTGARKTGDGRVNLLLGGFWVFREPPVSEGFSCSEAVVGVVDKE
jgi:hypothetical protein